MALWLTALAVIVGLLVATELAFRLGRRRRGRHDEVERTQITTMEAATLGLLALILGFTLSMAESRFDARRRVVLSEALAVGTTYLRAELLPEPGRSESRELLRNYVDARRAYFEASPGEVEPTTALAQAIHTELWRRAVAVGRAHPDWDLLGVYISSLNDMIDLETARAVSLAAHVPNSIHALLVLVALLAVSLAGYATGIAGPRSVFALLIVPLLIGLAYAVVLDLDRSRIGFISTGDLPMRRLQRSLATERDAR